MLNINIKIKTLAVFLILMLFPSSWVFADDYKVGILAFQPVEVAKARWQPLVTYLKQEIPQHTFEILPLNYKALNQKVQEHAIDFVFTNPGHYVGLKKKGLIGKALVSLVNEVKDEPQYRFGGVMFTLANRNDISTLESIVDKKIAAVCRDSLGGFQMQAYEFFRVGIEYNELHMLWTDMPHDNVVQKVLKHQADVGFVRTGVLESMIRDGKLFAEQVKVIHEERKNGFSLKLSTALYPEWAFAALTRKDNKIERLVSSALLNLPHHGKEAQAMGIHGFTIAADYSLVREVLQEMRMPPFDSLPAYVGVVVWDKYKWYFACAIIIVVMFIVFLIHLRRANKKLAQLTRKLDKLNHRDGLTNIPNRRLFDEQYDKELSRAKREKLPLAIIMIDIDYFKLFNDFYGHQKGDDCLKKVALTLAKGPHRATDIVCRYGGEEFVMILPNTNARAAMKVAESLRLSVEALQLPHKDSKASVHVSISLGVAAGVPNEHCLIDQADEALYAAKQSRNRVCLYDIKGDADKS